MKVFQELTQELYKKLFRSFEVPNSRVSRFQTLNFESFEVPNLELSNSRVSRFQTLNFGVSRFQTLGSKLRSLEENLETLEF